MKAKSQGRCAIFDLDGTLIDSREDIAAAVNMMRAELGLAPLPLQTVVSYVGDGVKKLVERSLRGESADLEKAQSIMKGCYKANLVGRTTLYLGVFEGVQRLRDASWRLAVISNKPTEFCRTILAHFKLEQAFEQIIGGGSGFPLKPEVEALSFVLKETASDPASSWVVGDNHTDLEAGARAGMKRCYASYGFGDPRDLKYELKIDSFLEFVEKTGA